MIKVEKRAFITLLTLLIIFTEVIVYTKSACIIIHGTWACDETWYTPRGDFFKSVARCAQELQIVDVVIPFSWSGKLSFQDQLQAAKNLIKVIEEFDWVILIGHSHGVTVGIICSRIMGENISNIKYFGKIKKFYALGVPVDPACNIYPDMSVIDKFYNLFSFGDYIQPVQDLYDRCFSWHERIANIAVQIRHEHPSHSQLHNPIIGKELLKIEEFFAQRCLGNFQNFSCHHPGMIEFYEHDLPVYFIQHNQKDLLELDKKARWMMTAAMIRNKKSDGELMND